MTSSGRCVRYQPPRSALEKARAYRRIFGWGAPSVTLIGLFFLSAMGWITLYGRKPTTWLELTALWSFAGLLALCGLWSLRERWLSLAPLEGLRPAHFRPRPWLRVTVGSGLLVLGTVLVVGSLTQPMREENRRWVVVVEGAFSLAGALIALRPFRPARQHVLVREGLAIGHRLGWTLVPWDHITSCVVTTDCDNVILSILWSGADILVWEWSCRMPPGIFMLQLEEALTDLVARERLPPFAEVARPAERGRRPSDLPQ